MLNIAELDDSLWDTFLLKKNIISFGNYRLVRHIYVIWYHNSFLPTVTSTSFEWRNAQRDITFTHSLRDATAGDTNASPTTTPGAGSDVIVLRDIGRPARLQPPWRNGSAWHRPRLRHCDSEGEGSARTIITMGSITRRLAAAGEAATGGTASRSTTWTHHNGCGCKYCQQDDGARTDLTNTVMALHFPVM